MKSIPLSLEYIILVKIRGKAEPTTEEEEEKEEEMNSQPPAGGCLSRKRLGGSPAVPSSPTETIWEAFLQGQRKEIQTGRIDRKAQQQCQHRKF